MATLIKNFKCLIHFNETQRGSILSEYLTYSKLHEMVMQKFNLEANAVIKLSFKLSSFDSVVDITDDAEGLYKGTNLAAVSMDGNNQIVPIEFGICKGETGPCWSWWMSVLKECIGDNPNLLFISDRHAAIALAVEKEFPLAFHAIITKTSIFNGNNEETNAAAQILVTMLDESYYDLEDSYTQVNSRQTQWQSDMEIIHQSLPNTSSTNSIKTSTAKEIWDNIEILKQGSGRQFNKEGNLFDDITNAFVLLETNQFMTTCAFPQAYLHSSQSLRGLMPKDSQETVAFYKYFDPLAYKLTPHRAPALFITSTPILKPTAHSPNDAFKFHIVTAPTQRKAPCNVGNTGARGNKENHKVETLKNELSQCKQEIYRLDTQKVKLDLENKVRQEQALVIQRNKRNAELVQENDLLKSTLSGKEKSIAFLQSEKEKIFSEKKDLADSYLENSCLKNANKVARDMLQRFNMPTQTIPMLSKKPKAATADLHKDLLEVLVQQVVSMKKMSEKPGHVRPANGFYDKLNALKFVPQQELSREQAYLAILPMNVHQQSNPNSPVTPFVRKSRPPSQVLTSLRNVNAVFPQFEGIIKERTTQKPDYVSEWCFDYAKQFVEQQLCPPSSNCLCDDLRSACDREHTKVLELEAEVFKQQKMVIESEKRNSHLQKNHIDLQLKFQNYKQCIDTSSASNAIFEINKLRNQLQGKDDTIRNLRNSSQLTRMLNEANTHSRTANTEKLSALTAENTKLKAQVTGVKPTSGASKTVPKRAPRNHSSLPVKSANARRVEAHHRTLNKKNRVDSNLLVKHSVSVSNLNNVCAGCNKSLAFANHSDCLVMCDGSVNVKPHQTKRFKPVKKVWKPISKPVANSKPQWKPTGRHFSLFEKYPLTRIMGTN
ncbi:retrovirus-related pol polyprotein from transposon TNT 1-94 [Tanacetum coccineum]